MQKVTVLVSGINPVSGTPTPNLGQYTEQQVPMTQQNAQEVQIAPRTSGLVITPTFDASLSGGAISAINAAITEMEALITDNITVSIYFADMNTGLGSSATFLDTLAYSTYYSTLNTKVNPGGSPDQIQAFTTLPNTANPPAPLPQTGNLQLTLPLMRLFGQSGTPPTGYFTTNPPIFAGATGAYDSLIQFNTSICNFTRPGADSSKYDLQGVALHEMDEVLGTSSALPSGSNATPPDLFRYSAASTRTFTGATGTAYFSIDSGTTDLADYNNIPNGGDYGDWLSLPNLQPIRCQNAFAMPVGTPAGWVDLVNPYGNTATPWLTPPNAPPSGTLGVTPGKSPELRVLNVIGWTLANPLPCIHADMLVETRNGIKKISEIVKGDEVRGSNDEYIPVIYNIVLEDTNDFYKFTKDSLGENQPSQDFYMHGGHPLLYQGKEWLPSDFVEKEIKGVEKVTLDEKIRIYSLCTEDRTFFKVSGLMVQTWAQKDWNECSAKYGYLYNIQ